MYDVSFKMASLGYYLLIDFEGTGVLEEVKKIVERIGYDIRVSVEDNEVSISCKVNMTEVSIDEIGKALIEIEGIVR